jgi:simple sugar transport system permease protein
VSSAAILVALILALLITCLVYKDISLFGKILVKFFTAPFSDAKISSTTISRVAIFVVAATSFLIASKCGLFNIGISGQMFFGAAIATIAAQHMISVPNGLSQIILLLISVISAMLIAGIIGLLKAYLNVNEVVSSIMFNWIIYFIATFLLASFCAASSDGLYTHRLDTLNGSSPNLVFLMNGSS